MAKPGVWTKKTVAEYPGGKFNLPNRVGLFNSTLPKKVTYLEPGVTEELVLGGF